MGSRKPSSFTKCWFGGYSKPMMMCSRYFLGYAISMVASSFISSPSAGDVAIDGFHFVQPILPVFCRDRVYTSAAPRAAARARSGTGTPAGPFHDACGTPIENRERSCPAFHKVEIEVSCATAFGRGFGRTADQRLPVTGLQTRAAKAAVGRGVRARTPLDLPMPPAQPGFARRARAACWRGPLPTGRSLPDL